MLIRHRGYIAYIKFHGISREREIRAALTHLRDNAAFSRRLLSVTNTLLVGSPARNLKREASLALYHPENDKTSD